MPEPSLEATGGVLGPEIEQHLGGGDVERRVALEDGLVSDVAGKHGFAEPLSGHKNQVLAVRDERSRQRALDGRSIDLGGPVPIELVDGLEAPELGVALASHERASFAFREFHAREFFEQHARPPASLGSTCEEVIEILCSASEFERRELSGQLIVVRCRGLLRRRGSRGHRRSPDHEG